MIGGAGFAQGPGVDLAVLQHLGGADAHGAAGGALDADADAADEVLAEVQDAAPVGDGQHRDGPDLLGAAHRRSRRGDERARVAVADGDGAHPSSSNPGSDQPVGSRRAS